MKVRDIASKIIISDDIPVHFTDTKTYATVTYLKSGTEKERGLYLPDCDSCEAIKYCKENAPDRYETIQNIICTKCAFDDITFTMFCVLHEIGHWIQYTDFINEGHNDQEFIFTYEIKRALFYSKRKVEFYLCKCEDDVKALNKKYDRLYAELPTEQYADNFAIERLPKYMIKL